jgi:NAD+ synthase
MKWGIFMSFQAEKVTEAVVQWIRDWFEENGKGCNAIVGISGGKDSSVVAALCVKALGKEHVIGVLMPNGVQHDIDMAELLVRHLGIEHYTVNIQSGFNGVLESVTQALGQVSVQTRTNLAPRIRMSALYAVGQSKNGRIANTCNLSEDWVGYSTRYGDCAGDFSPLSQLTVQEVKAIGAVLGLPDVLVHKVPIDGLCGRTDEDNLGFTYAVLDRYIREGVCEDEQVREKIDRMHRMNQFKLAPMPFFAYTAKQDA